MTEGFWRPMQAEDLPSVSKIAALCHRDYPERCAVFAEKYSLSPESCFVFGGPPFFSEAGVQSCASRQEQVAQGTPEPPGVLGYCLAHPYQEGKIVPLDSFLGALPQRCDTLYLHDIALLPAMRKKGAGTALLKILWAYAQKKELKSLSLIAVHDSYAYWCKHGFARAQTCATRSQELLSYGCKAIYMCLKIGENHRWPM